MSLEDDIKRKISITFSLRGEFNPGIFQPYWFKHVGLLEEEDFLDGIEVIHPSVSLISTKFIKLKVTTDSFTATTDSYDFKELYFSVVSGIFTILGQSPIYNGSLQISYHQHLEEEKLVEDLFTRTIYRESLDRLFETKAEVNEIDVHENLNDGYNYRNTFRVLSCPNNKSHLQFYLARQLRFPKHTFTEIIPTFLKKDSEEIINESIGRIVKYEDFEL